MMEDKEHLVSSTIFLAQKMIEQHGWVRGALCTEDGYCIVGAILAVQKDADVQELAFERIRHECGKLYVTWWNDDFAKDKKEVLVLLKKAARKLPNNIPRRAGAERGSIYSFC